MLAACPACGAGVRLDGQGRPLCTNGHRIFGRVTMLRPGPTRPRPRPLDLFQVVPPIREAAVGPVEPPAAPAPPPTEDGSQCSQPSPGSGMGGRACGPPPAQVDILTAPDFREWLKIAREAARVTQVELAKKVGVHPMTLSKIERGIYSCPQPLQLALRYLLELPR